MTGCGKTSDPVKNNRFSHRFVIGLDRTRKVDDGQGENERHFHKFDPARVRANCILYAGNCLRKVLFHKIAQTQADR
jgi:hypothetical protein